MAARTILLLCCVLLQAWAAHGEAFDDGDLITIQGLKSEWSFNGKSGVIKDKRLDDKGKLLVRVDGETFRIKPENLAPDLAALTATQAPVPPEAPPTFAVGDAVVLKKYEEDPELVGKEAAVVKAWHGKYKIKVEGKYLTVQPEIMEHFTPTNPDGSKKIYSIADVVPGATVTIQNLEHDAQFNGRKAMVRKVLPDNVLEIKVDDHVFGLPVSNVQELMGEQPSSATANPFAAQLVESPSAEEELQPVAGQMLTITGLKNSPQYNGKNAVVQQVKEDGMVVANVEGKVVGLNKGNYAKVQAAHPQQVLELLSEPEQQPEPQEHPAEQAAAAEDGKEAEAPLQAGDHVKVVGLAAMSEYNGKQAVIASADEDGVFSIVVEGKQFQIKQQNLEREQQPEEVPEAEAALESEQNVQHGLGEGDRVTLQGLGNQQAYNGQEATVQKVAPNGVVTVVADDGKRMGVAADNVAAAAQPDGLIQGSALLESTAMLLSNEVHVGDAVIIVGLQADPSFNGKVVVVKSIADDHVTAEVAGQDVELQFENLEKVVRSDSVLLEMGDRVVIQGVEETSFAATAAGMLGRIMGSTVPVDAGMNGIVGNVEEIGQADTIKVALSDGRHVEAKKWNLVLVHSATVRPTKPEPLELVQKPKAELKAAPPVVPAPAPAGKAYVRPGDVIKVVRLGADADYNGKHAVVEAVGADGLVRVTINGKMVRLNRENVEMSTIKQMPASHFASGKATYNLVQTAHLEPGARVVVHGIEGVVDAEANGKVFDVLKTLEDGSAVVEFQGEVVSISTENFELYREPEAPEPALAAVQEPVAVPEVGSEIVLKDLETDASLNGRHFKVTEVLENGGVKVDLDSAMVNVMPKNFDLLPSAAPATVEAAEAKTVPLAVGSTVTLKNLVADQSLNGRDFRVERLVEDGAIMIKLDDGELVNLKPENFNVRTEPSEEAPAPVDAHAAAAVNVDPDTEAPAQAGAEPEVKADAEPAALVDMHKDVAAAAPAPVVGEMVTLKNLDKDASINGKSFVVDNVYENGDIDITLEDGEDVLVKAINYYIEGKPAEAETGLVQTQVPPAVGATVELKGLSADGALNGQRFGVTSVNEDGSVSIKLDEAHGSDAVRVEAKNFDVVGGVSEAAAAEPKEPASVEPDVEAAPATPGTDNAPAVENAQAVSTEIPAGSKVTLKNLANDASQNGKTFSVISSSSDGKVKIDVDGELVMVEPRNFDVSTEAPAEPPVEAPALSVGQTITIRGLEGPDAELNGKSFAVKSIFESEPGTASPVIVTLESGEEVKVLPEHYTVDAQPVAMQQHAESDVKVGSKVILKGLTEDTVHNGHTFEVTEVKDDGSVYIRMEDDSINRVEPVHFDLATDGTAVDAPMLPAFQVGDIVKVVGLKETPDFNGKVGAVFFNVPKDGLLQVRIAGRIFNIAPENLEISNLNPEDAAAVSSANTEASTIVSIRVGEKVVIKDLASDTEYNGKTVTVQEFADEDVYVITDDGEELTIPRQNLAPIERTVSGMVSAGEMAAMDESNNEVMPVALATKVGPPPPRAFLEEMSKRYESPRRGATAVLQGLSDDDAELNGKTATVLYTSKRQHGLVTVEVDGHQYDVPVAAVSGARAKRTYPWMPQELSIGFNFQDENVKAQMSQEKNFQVGDEVRIHEVMDRKKANLKNAHGRIAQIDTDTGLMTLDVYGVPQPLRNVGPESLVLEASAAGPSVEMAQGSTEGMSAEEKMAQLKQRAIIKEGTKVVLKGFSKKSGLNGKVGHMLDGRVKNGEVMVEVDGEVHAVAQNKAIPKMELLKPGDEVVLTGLLERPELNGEVVEVKNPHPNAEGEVVVAYNEQNFNINLANLEDAPDEMDDARVHRLVEIPSGLKPLQRAIVTGLTEHPEYNGKLATVKTGLITLSGDVVVDIDNRELKIRPINLQPDPTVAPADEAAGPIRLTQGGKAMLHGLDTDTSYNGRQALVIKHLKDNDWEVVVDDSHMVVSGEHLRPISDGFMQKGDDGEGDVHVTDLDQGDLVTLQGMGDKAFNGKTAHVVRGLRVGLVKVEVEGKILDVPRASIGNGRRATKTMSGLSEGQTVQIEGLKDHTAFNGKQAVVISGDLNDKGEVFVACEGQNFNIMPINLKATNLAGEEGGLPSGLLVGQQATITGLTSNSEYNGKLVTVVNGNLNKLGEVTVTDEAGKKLRLRPLNLDKVGGASTGSSNTQLVSHESEGGAAVVDGKAVAVGDTFLISGLRQMAAYNGKPAVAVTTTKNENGEIYVEVEGSKFGIRPENLQAKTDSIRKGSIVAVTGLHGHPEFNGKHGYVTSSEVDDKGELSLSIEGKPYTLRPEFLKVVSSPFQGDKANKGGFNGAQAPNADHPSVDVTSLPTEDELKNMPRAAVRDMLRNALTENAVLKSTADSLKTGPKRPPSPAQNFAQWMQGRESSPPRHQLGNNRLHPKTPVAHPQINVETKGLRQAVASDHNFNEAITMAVEHNVADTFAKWTNTFAPHIAFALPNHNA